MHECKGHALSVPWCGEGGNHSRQMLVHIQCTRDGNPVIGELMMRRIKEIIAVGLIGTAGGCISGVEQAKYQVRTKDGNFELRDYAPHIVAETVVDGSMKDAGNQAFGRLFGYISGKNRSRAKIAMTAPVSQRASGEKIAMTAPVGQQRTDAGWAVSFKMPASFSMDTLPSPEDPQVVLREVPASRMAAVRYSGTWSTKRYDRHERELEDWIRKMEYSKIGDPAWARYNPPFTPWFLRRNEILIPVAQQAQHD